MTPIEITPDSIHRLPNVEWLGKEWLSIVDETGSTNADLLQNGADLPHGALLIADHQTAGRGRRERRWFGLPGRDLLFSFLLRPDVDREIIPSLSLAIGLTAADAIRQFVGSAVRLKWPNDVLVAGRKICGILCQSSLAENPFVVVGVGINVNSRADERPAELRSLAISLADFANAAIPRPDVLRHFLPACEKRYAQWRTDRRRLFADWERQANLKGQTITVKDDEQTFTAVAIALDDFGNLIVETGGQRRLVTCGDVFLQGD
ncbi:MAG: biotin--[acetyl-CoA-carboxylase] ligase [Myxococcales bacterium]|nr:biotin--[acetyl-CoA-carboxylase] ligase [Myxococcales bacterium]